MILNPHPEFYKKRKEQIAGMKGNNRNKLFLSIFFLFVLLSFIEPENVFATQIHTGSEGIIVHQLGHLFFLFSMVILIFAINGKGLDKEKGWRLIQYSAFLFILWNLDAMCVHFLDNQIKAVRVENISQWTMKITSVNNSTSLDWIYYILKLDHIFCVPALFMLYKGLSKILETEREKAKVHSQGLNIKKTNKTNI